MKKAYFAGGCFWCMEAPFLALDGVEDVIPGYMGGTLENPTYEDVCTGKTGHYEIVRVTYDEKVVTFETLLNIFWEKVDPTDPFGQLMDRGSQYKTAIFYTDESEKLLAEGTKNALNDSGRYARPVVTEILEASTFYEAESYHHHYYEKLKKRFSGINIT